MAWNTFKHPSTQFKPYLIFDTTSYTYRWLLSSLPVRISCFSLYGLFKWFAQPVLLRGGRHHNIGSWAAAASCCWKKLQVDGRKVGKSCKQTAERLEKSCNKAVQRLEKSCNNYAKTQDNQQVRSVEGTIANKALLIKGARQVGKTTVMRQLAKANYKNFVEVNLEQHIITLTY